MVTIIPTSIAEIALLQHRLNETKSSLKTSDATVYYYSYRPLWRPVYAPVIMNIISNHFENQVFLGSANGSQPQLCMGSEDYVKMLGKACSYSVNTYLNKGPRKAHVHDVIIM